jgi:mannosyltransferase OCH1-like enzyme
MIEKNIHYCWFGDSELSELNIRCLESWHKYMPEYKILKWSNSDLDLSDPLEKHLFDKKLWAFLSDYVRLKKLYAYGGIYFDVDIEVVKPLHDLRNFDCFIGQELPGRLNTAVLGASKNAEYVGACIKKMKDRFDSNKSFLIAPELSTLVYNEGFESSDSVKLMPVESFYPYNPYDEESLGFLMYSDIKEQTYCIHHWGKSWNESFISKLKRKIQRVFD